MLVVKALENIDRFRIKKNDKLTFYVVDAHHHLGREGGHQNTPTGSYDFYTLLWFEIKRMASEMKENDELLLEPIEVLPSATVSAFIGQDPDWTRINHGWLVDRTIAFPYTDDYWKSGFPEKASFSVSNDRIAGWTTRGPHSLRFIGFARVDPNDAQINPRLAVDEVNRAVSTLGLRGLKLHPLAQLFTDEIAGDLAADVVKTAGQFGVPVLFDTRSMKTVERIMELLRMMRTDKNYTKSLRGLKIIIAHCGMSPGDSKLYDALSDPIVFGEASSLHGKDIPVLLDMLQKRLSGQGFAWSEKMMFGTDYSFLTVQAADLILHLLSREFGGTPADIQRILGGNALAVTQRPFRSVSKVAIKPKQVAVKVKPRKLVKKTAEVLMNTIKSKKWQLSSLDFMLPPEHTCPIPTTESDGECNGVYLHSIIATLTSRSNKKQVQVRTRQLPGGYVAVFLGSTKEVSLPAFCESGLEGTDKLFLESLSEQTIIADSLDDALSIITQDL